MKRDDVDPRNVKRVRVGHGANCSSVGSVVDMLFASAVAGSALFAAVAAALSRERVEVVGASSPARVRDGVEPTADPAAKEDP